MSDILFEDSLLKSFPNFWFSGIPLAKQKLYMRNKKVTFLRATKLSRGRIIKFKYCPEMVLKVKTKTVQ